MRANRKLLIAAVATAFLATSALSFERQPGGELGLTVAPKAEARKVARGIGKAFRSVGGAISRGFRAVGRAMSRVAKTIGKGIVKGAKLVGKGLKKIGQGVVQVAKGVGKAVVGVAKGAVKFTRGVFKGAGRLLRGDFKGALNAVKAGAKAGFAEAKKGVVAGVKDVVAGAKKVVSGAMDVVKGAAQIALPFVDIDKVIAWVKKHIVGKLKDVGQAILNSKIGSVFQKILKVVAPDVAKTIETIRSLVSAGQKIIDVIQNPNEYLQKGREWAINKLTDLAMSVFEPPLKKLVGVITGFALKMLKHFVTTPLAAALGSAAGSVSFGIGAALTPLIKFAIDKLLDWAIGMVQDLLAKAVMAIQFVRNFLKNKIIGPIINKAYDAIIGFLKRKFPKLGEHLTTSKEQAAGVKAKPLFEKELGGVKRALDTVDQATDAVRRHLPAGAK
jgi:hypothetical protein